MGFNSKDDNVPTSGTQFIKSVLGVAPVGFGAAVGIGRLKASQTSFTQNLPTNSYGDMTASVGDSLRRYHSARQANKELKVKRFVDQLTSGFDLMKTLKESTESRNALLAAAVDSLDLIDDERAAAVRETLLEAIGDQDLTQQQLDSVSEEITALLERSSLSEREDFIKSYEDYGRVKNQIQAPRLKLQGVQSRAKIVSEGLGTSGKFLFDIMKKEVGGSAALQLLEYREPTGGKSYYALVGEGSRAFTVPLQLSRKLGVPILRTGSDLNTPYTINPYFADATDLYNTIQSMPVIDKEIGKKMAKGKGRVLKRFPFIAVEEFRRRSQAAGGVSYLSGRDFETWQRTFGQPAPGPLEVRSFMDQGGPTNIESYGLHARQAVIQRHAQVTVVGVERLDGPDLPAALAVRSGTRDSFFDPRKPEVHRMQNGSAYMNIGLGNAGKYKGPLVLMRPTGVDTRQTLPITARPRQMFGRTLRFTPGSSRKLGATFRTVGSPIEFTADMSVYATNINRAALLDVFDESAYNQWVSTSKYAVAADKAYAQTRGVNPLTLEEGQIFIDEALSVEEQFSRTIYDPYKDKKLSSSRLLNYILDKGEISIEGGSRLSEFFGKTHGYLGRNAGGIVKLPNYAGMTGLTVRAERRANGRIVLSGIARYTPKEPKIFSGVAKATARRFGTEDGPRKILSRVGAEALLDGSQSALEGLGKPIIGTGAMMGKAPMHLAQQMISGLGMLVNYTHPSKLFREISEKVNPDDADNYIKNVMRAVIRETPESVDPVKFGGVLAGVFHLGGKYGVTPEVIEKTLGAKGFSDDFIAKTMRSASRGITLGATTITPGPEGTLWKAAQGSMEPRFYQFLQHNLITSGIKPFAVEGIVQDMLLRKGTTPQQAVALSGLTGMVSSMRGPKGLVDSRMGDLERVSVDEFISRAQRGSDSFTEWIGSKSDAGFVLDTSQSKRSVTSAFQQVFRSEELRLTSGSSVRAMKRISIRQGSGEVAQTTRLLPKYIANLSELGRVLERLDQVGQGTAEEQKAAQEALRAWKKDTMNLWADSYDTLLRGNLRGSGFVQASGLSVFSDWGDISLSPMENIRARDILSQNQAASAFIDTQGFLDSLRTFTSGTTDYYSSIFGANRAAKMAQDDLGDILKRFFMSPYMGDNLGVPTIVSRHPILGSAHVTPTALYRALPETKLLTNDTWFRRFASSPEGRATLAKIDPISEQYRAARDKYKKGVEAWRARKDKVAGAVLKAEDAYEEAARAGASKKRLKRLRQSVVAAQKVNAATKRPRWEDFNPDPQNKRIRSFADLKRLSEDNMDYFFTEMGKVLHKVEPLQGGGRIFLTPQNAQMKISGSSGKTVREFEISIATGMLADRDADMIQIYHPSQEARKAIQTHALKGSKAAIDFAVLRVETGLIFDELNKGIKAFSKSQGEATLDPLLQLQEAILKEFAGRSIGPVDVSLKPLIYGIHNSIDPSDRESVRLANRTVALLVAIEEGTLKSKKLNKFVDLGDLVRRSLQLTYADEQTDISGFRRLIKETLLRDSGLMDGGLTLTDISGTDIPTGVGQALENHSVALGDEVFDLIRESAIWVKENNLQNVQTADQLARVAASPSMGFETLMSRTANPTSALIGGDFEMKALGKIARALEFSSRAGAKMLGPLTLGAIAGVSLSAVAGAVLGEGPDGAALDVPGQMPSAYRIQPAPQLDPEKLAHKEILNQNIMPAGTTYQDRSSAYRIRGGVVDESAGYRLGGILNRMGVPASMLINDRRLPITSSYVEQGLAD